MTKKIEELKLWSWRKTTTTETDSDGFIEIQVTSCCKVGPITKENYCPNCGKKIEKKMTYFSPHPKPLPKVKEPNTIKKVSNKKVYRCSDGALVSQAYIEAQKTKVYSKGFKTARCEAYPNEIAEGHSHIVKQSTLKEIGMTELIWSPDMFCYESHRANSEWDNASACCEDHANIVKKMSILYIFDKPGFWKRFDRFSNFKVMEEIRKVIGI